MANNSSNNLPAPQSYEQILGDALSAYAAKVGIDDFNVGSAVTGFFEVVALIAARSSGDLFQILRDFSVDRATGDALQRLATENGITPITAKPTTGNVTILDTSFVKISSSIYAGSMPPNIGSTVINVSDASKFPSSGAIYLGRTTPNIEGPIFYSTPPVQVGSFWQITLNTPTTKYHNLGETVILSQGGNRSIPTGTMVLSPAIGANPDIQYSITIAAIILDGETSVSNVLVTAILPGSTGNVPANAISSFAAPPFTGATVSNPLAFTTGLDNETDQQLRVRIKAQLASTGLGTATAIKAAVIGATSQSSSSSIASASIVLQTNGSAILYIDNGFGYEALSQGVGLESIVNDAIGGEQFFQLATGGSQAPVAKAFLQSTNESPFDLRQGDTLAVNVGGIIFQHIFADSDFVNPGGATSYEVTASINADTLLGFEATTAGSGKFVVIRAKAESHDNIQIALPTTSGRDASILLAFPSSLSETLRLYKNNIPLDKDGQVAALFSQAQSLWSNTIQNGDTLILQVDKTDFITYTITDADFIATQLYTTVSSTNSLVAWQKVLQNKLTGVTVSISGQQLEIVSNLEANNRAQLSIDPASTLVTKGMFSTIIGLSAVGKSSDYTLSRNTAQFELTLPLQAGDKLSAGSVETAAVINSAAITGSSITFSAEAYFWLLQDSPGTIILTGVTANSVLVVSKPAPNIVRYTSSTINAFGGVLPGDYLIVWSAELNPLNRLEGRVHAASTNQLDIAVTDAEYAAAVPESTVFVDGFVVLRSPRVPRKFSLPIGTSSLDQIALYLEAQTDQLTFSIQQEEILIIRTTTLDSNGYLLVVTADTNGQLLGLPIGTSSISQTSLIAYEDSASFDGQMPLFLQTKFAADSLANPPDSFVASVTSDVSLSVADVPNMLPAFDPNDLIGFLHPYGAIRDEQPALEFDQMSSIAGALIGLAPQGLVRRIRGNSGIIQDRFFIANPLDFGDKDNFTVILDNDPTTKSFSIPLYRAALANNTHILNPNNFNAYDVSAGPTASFANPLTFGAFSFSNFKVLMQAKHVLKAQAPQTAILYRATAYGRSGELITVEYAYPTAPNGTLGSTIEVGETTKITIFLASGIPAVTNIDMTTQWNVSITPNTPFAGVDQVTYTWNGVGTAPALTLAGGEYVNITNQTNFATNNQGVYRVSTQGGFTPTATSFSVVRPNGVAVAETNVPTNVNGAITFYQASPTTAAQIQAYVAANLVDITATLVNDGGTSGSGVITFSTYEDTNFVSQNVQLLDGINWIFASNVNGSPQFTFKKPLSYSADGPANAWYQFNNYAYGVAAATGEQVILSPTTMEQVKNLLSVLAVTGFTTLGNLTVVERGSKLEIATITLGSQGAVQVIGGYANGYSVPVLDSGSRVDNSVMSVSVNKVAANGLLSDQWFRLQASKTQIKDTLFSSNTDITIVPNNPVVLKSTVELSNKSLTQRNFGKPRNHIRSQGDTFRIEKQGALVCLSWNQVGTSPHFLKSALNFNDTPGGSPSPILTISEPLTFGGIGWSLNTNFFSQAFQMPAGPSQAITQIQVDVAQNGVVIPNSPVVLEIRAATSSVPDHFPTGPVLATSNPILANSLPTSHGTLTAFTFPTLVALTPNQFYSFAVRSSVTLTTNTLNVSGQAPVIGGLRAAETTNSGTSWSSFGNGAFSSYIITAQSLSVGTFNAASVVGSDDVQYTILTGNTNFTELSIGDLITISGMSVPENNGTFLVTGVSDDGKTVEVLNGKAKSVFSSGSFDFSANANSGDVFVINATNLTAGRYAFFTGVPPGDATSVTITANNLGTIGNAVSLSFDGSTTTINAAIASWNFSNPLNQVTLTSGNGAQIPVGTGTASFVGAIGGAFATVTDTVDSPNIVFTANFDGVAGNSISLVFDGVMTVATVVGNWNTANPTNTVSFTGSGSVVPAANTWNLSGGTGTSVTITANNPGTQGNNVLLSFNGVNDINGAIATWNAFNLTNQVTLSSGNGAQVPTTGATAPFTGGVGDTIVLTGGVNGQFAIGATASITEANLSFVIGNMPGLMSSVSGSSVIVTGTTVGQVVTLTYTPFSTTQVTVTAFGGTSFGAGQFSAYSSVSEGDTMVVNAPFNVLNRGRFRVIRRYNDSVWFENKDVLEEEVTLPYNPVNLSFDGTTGFNISTFNNHAFLKWNGTGTEPLLGMALMGDIITFGTDFPAAYRGSFMVLKSGPKLQEITTLSLPPASAFTLSGPGPYFTIYASGDINKYYVWFNYNGANTDPAPGGYTSGIMIAVSLGWNSIQVANAVATALNGFALQFTALAASNIVTLTTVGFDDTTASVNNNMPLPFALSEAQPGTPTFIEAINPASAGQGPANVTITNVLTDHRPQLQFSEYEATMPGDKFVVTGNVLGPLNVGEWVIDKVIDENTAIVVGTMSAITGANLTGAETSVFVEEGTAYTGYKQVQLINSQPGSSVRKIVVLNTNAQYEKINEASGTEMVAQNKIGFGTTLVNGLDSYKFNTDLIQIANKIVYGDPTNSTTYPGVGAAGAEIFIQEPLALRISVSIDVRLQTGVAFAYSVQQIRSTVGALVNSNPVGQSISLSSIVGAVSAIPGVISVVITSPQYNSTHDLIVVEPSEKTLIIDPAVDISVAQIGN